VVAQLPDNMDPLDWADGFDVRLDRHGIETINSQLEKMGIEHLYARTNPGFAQSAWLFVCFGMLELRLAIKVDYFLIRGK